MACSFSDEIVSKTTIEFEKWQEKNTSDIIVLVEVLSLAIYCVFIDGVFWAKNSTFNFDIYENQLPYFSGYIKKDVMLIFYSIFSNEFGGKV